VNIPLYREPALQQSLHKNSYFEGIDGPMSIVKVASNHRIVRILSELFTAKIVAQPCDPPDSKH
jgi:hypothetical protein